MVDARSVMDLHLEQLGRSLDGQRVHRLLSSYPSLMAEADGRLVGFAYSDRFAPDVVELANILIARELRCEGLGSRLLSAFESVAGQHFSAVILANSDLYEDHRSEKRSARSFYERAGYSAVFATPDSEIFTKHLT